MCGFKTATKECALHTTHDRMTWSSLLYAMRKKNQFNTESLGNDIIRGLIAGPNYIDVSRYFKIGGAREMITMGQCKVHCSPRSKIYSHTMNHWDTTWLKQGLVAWLWSYWRLWLFEVGIRQIVFSELAVRWIPFLGGEYTCTVCLGPPSVGQHAL